MAKDFAEREDNCNCSIVKEFVKNSGEENFAVKKTGSVVKLKMQLHFEN